MAGQFNSDKAQAKWDYLEATGKQSLDRVKAGTASKYDYQKVSQILDQYDKLAKTVFDEAVDTMEASAQAIVERIMKDREAKGKAPLTEDSAQKLFDLALKRAFDDYGPEIVETIDTMLDKKLDEQDELTGYRIDDAVDKIRNFISDQKDEREWKEKVEQIGDEVEKRFRKSIFDIAEEARQQVAKGPAAAQGSAVAGLLPALSGGGPGRMSLLDRMRMSLGGVGRGFGRGASALAARGGSFLNRTRAFMQSMALSNTQSTPAQTKQTSILDSLNTTIQKFIKGSKQAAAAGRDRVKRTVDGMLKKYDTMRKFFSDKWSNLKSKAGKIASGSLGMLSKIGKGLLLSLVYSPLIKTLIDKFGENFTAANMKEKLGEAWDWAKDNAPKALEWVWDKVSNFDYQGVAEKVWGWIKDMSLGTRKEREKEAAARHEETKPIIQETGGGAAIFHHTGMRRTKAAQAALQAGGGGNGGASTATTGVTGPASSTQAANGMPDLPAEVMKGATTQKQFETQKAASDAMAAASSTSVAPSNITTNQYTGGNTNLTGVFNGGKTRAVPAQSVMFKSPVNPSETPTTTGGGSGGGGLPAANKGGKANIMGLSSFGLTSGVNDTLGLMNLGVVQ